TVALVRKPSLDLPCLPALRNRMPARYIAAQRRCIGCLCRLATSDVRRRRSINMRARYALMFFTLAGAGACALFAVDEYRLSARSSQEPEEISLRNLINRGPNGNPNIILTDFSIFEDYVYQKKLVSGRWTKVWVPIVPTDKEDTPGKS